jgi:hypothetical protein
MMFSVEKNMLFGLVLLVGLIAIVSCAAEKDINEMNRLVSRV